MMGVVFCGGKSTRMGKDKGLILSNVKTWAEIALEKLESLSIPVCISINSSQKEEYQQIFEVDRLIEDCFPLEGPLCGLLSVHNSFPYHDLVILACDMIDISPSLINRLLNELREHEGEHDFFVFENEGHIEPLLGVYTREGLQKLSDLYTLGLLEKYSMKQVLESGNTLNILVKTDVEKSQFKNYNSATEIT